MIMNAASRSGAEDSRQLEAESRGSRGNLSAADSGPGTSHAPGANGLERTTSKSERPVSQESGKFGREARPPSASRCSGKHAQK